MRKLLLIILTSLVTSSTEMKAQITLEHTFNSTYIGGSGNFYCADIGGNDFKYVFMNKVTNSFSLFNLDMSPYLSNIVIPTTSDSIAQGFVVNYVSKSLFDCDTNNIEYVFEWQWDVTRPFRVFRTDGTLLFKQDSANGPYCGGCYGGAFDIKPIINTNAGAKMFLQKYDANNVPQILVYALCGTVPNNSIGHDGGNVYVKLYPNPATQEVVFEIVGPNNTEELYVNVMDASARLLVQREPCSGTGKVSIDISSFSSGVYFYSVYNNSNVLRTGKFIINQTP